MSDLGRRFPDDYTLAELHAIATRALANGDDYARALLREQLNEEEFSQQSDIAPRAGRAALHQSRVRIQRPLDVRGTRSLKNGKLMCVGRGCHSIYEPRDVIDPANDDRLYVS